MLTLAAIKENPQEIVRRLAVKHFDAEKLINEILELDQARRTAQARFDQNGADLNKLAAQIGALMKSGKKDEAEGVKAQVAELKAANKAIEEEVKSAADKITEILLSIPNTPCAMVPEGKTAEDNVVEKTGGQMPDLPEDALPHWELAKKYNLIDFELGVKITGAGFPVYFGKERIFSARSSNSSSTKPQRQAISRHSHLTWSTRHRASAQVNCPTKRDRCITATLTTCISSRQPKCLSPTSTAM